MCNPNLFGSILARLTRERGLDVALVQLGATLASTSPPTRIAEEYAVLDCLSDGRLIAGVPVGIGADAGMSYGVPPIVQRARWREGIELMLRAWTDPEVFAWNGEHYQLRSVNLWPRPVQTPHPPLLVPGRAQRVDVGHVPRARLAVRVPELLRRGCRRVGHGRLLARAEAHGRDRNPYRAAFLQLVAVADTDEQAEAQYGRAPRVLLQEAPALPAAVLHAARIRRVHEPARTFKAMLEFADRASTSRRSARAT